MLDGTTSDTTCTRAVLIVSQTNLRRGTHSSSPVHQAKRGAERKRTPTFRHSGVSAVGRYRDGGPSLGRPSLSVANDHRERTIGRQATDSTALRNAYDSTPEIEKRIGVNPAIATVLVPNAQMNAPRRSSPSDFSPPLPFPPLPPFSPLLFIASSAVPLPFSFFSVIPSHPSRAKRPHSSSLPHASATATRPPSNCPSS
ncbi:hypothetical protein CRENBAI_016092 [Crenichthys baileyi]|uniref:Uncharacterized protein n=1 Tax=Crenichthys baileyi TaxID=28760 RepID=A0AAV9RCB2_9TELE